METAGKFLYAYGGIVVVVVVFLCIVPVVVNTNIPKLLLLFLAGYEYIGTYIV